MKEWMKAEGVRKQWERYKYAVLVVLIGAGLLLWPSGGGGTKTAPGQAEERDIQTEMEEILSKISGVGEVRVMLTEDTDGERRLARNTEVTVRGDPLEPEDYSKSSEAVMEDSGGDNLAVITQTQYPTYRGALVVCQGGDRADVRLAVTQAVASLTGLSADRITVAKWQ